MIMDRKEVIQKAAEEARAASAETLTTHGVHSYLDDIPFIDLSYDEIAESAFVKGAEWANKKKEYHKNMCFRDKTKVCNLCHECDVNVMNPSY